MIGAVLGVNQTVVEHTHDLYRSKGSGAAFLSASSLSPPLCLSHAARSASTHQTPPGPFPALRPLQAARTLAVVSIPYSSQSTPLPAANRPYTSLLHTPFLCPTFCKPQPATAPSRPSRAAGCSLPSSHFNPSTPLSPPPPSASCSPSSPLPSASLPHLMQPSTLPRRPLRPLQVARSPAFLLTPSTFLSPHPSTACCPPSNPLPYALPPSLP